MADAQQPKAFCPACGTPNLNRKPKCVRCGADLLAAAAAGAGPRKAKSTMVLGTMNPYQSGGDDKATVAPKRRGVSSNPPPLSGRTDPPFSEPLAPRRTTTSIPPPLPQHTAPQSLLDSADESDERPTVIGGGPNTDFEGSPPTSEALLDSLDAKSVIDESGLSGRFNGPSLGDRLAEIAAKLEKPLEPALRAIETMDRRSLARNGLLTLLGSNFVTLLLALLLGRACSPAASAAPDLDLELAAYTSSRVALGAITAACAAEDASQAAHWFHPAARKALLEDACKLEGLAGALASFDAIGTASAADSKAADALTAIELDPADCVVLTTTAGDLDACFFGEPKRFAIAGIRLAPTAD